MDDDIRQHIMDRRTQAGLKLVLHTPDGLCTLYPKDGATKARWIAAAGRRGYVVLEDR